MGTKSDGTEVTAYVEPQRALQCGAHALNAILARSAVSGPGYFYTDLVNSNAPRRPVSANGLPDALIHYTLNGMYSVKAVNHWLYEHTTSAVVLTDIITGYRGEHSPAVSYTQHEILAHAPPGCRAFFVHEGGAQSGHYKAWVESQGQWYECDSLTCTAARDRIKILNERDWELATGKGNTFYCLVARDAYLCDRTLTSPAADVRQDVNTAGVTWVDGTTLEISRHTTRRVPARQTRIPERLDLSDSPLQKETRKELQKTTSSPLEMKGPVEPGDAPMQRKVQDTKVGSDKETPKASLKPLSTENTQPTPVPQRSTNVSQKLPASKAHASKHRKERVTKPPWQAATSNKQKKAACHKRQLLPGQRKLNDFLKKPTMQSPKAPTKMPTAPSGPPRFDAQASKPPHTDDQKPDQLVIMTLNAQSLETSKMHITDITNNKLGPVPDIMVLTETKAKMASVHTTWMQLKILPRISEHSTIQGPQQSRSIDRHLQTAHRTGSSAARSAAQRGSRTPATRGT